MSVFVPNATAATLPPTGTPSQLLAVDVLITGVGFFRINSANLMKNFIKLSVVPGNLTMDQYRGFRTITLCPATQTNPPCSSLRATVTKLPSKGTVFQPLMTAGTLSDKRGPPILSVNSIILPSISAAGNVIILQYQAREVGVKPVAGAIWDYIECEPNMRFYARACACVCLFV